ncbi:MAG: ferredoxin family protein [Coriobacteriales bacterium]|jgi:ferredoxin-like protein FixX|nr:ferredoxin family protein [Coriobacteriales bacterium]
MIRTISVNVDEKLSVDKFNIDERNPHIILKDNPSTAEVDKLILCCPAALYKRDSQGEVSFDYAGCLECGTCRILAQDTVLEKWQYPGDARGISYRYG